MPELKLNTLYEANGYINGRALFGQSEEFTIPGIKPKMNDHKGMGIAGTIETPSGFEKMEVKFKANSLYPDVTTEFANIYKEHQVLIFGNLQNWQGNNLTGEQAAKVTMKGKSKGTPDITVKHQDNPELQYALTITMVKVEVAGKVLYHLDLLANIFIVDGVDMWASRRQNL